MNLITHRSEIERLERELAESREECRRLKMTLEAINNNAPKEDPRHDINACYQFAWAMWIAGQLATKALAPKVGDK